GFQKWVERVVPHVRELFLDLRVHYDQISLCASVVDDVGVDLGTHYPGVSEVKWRGRGQGKGDFAPLGSVGSKDVRPVECTRGVFTQSGVIDRGNPQPG